jgi:hypothetical protein
MALLTVFANFFINTEERWLRVQDSFLSFKDVAAQEWVVNVRGQYWQQVVAFLHHHLGDKLRIYHIESEKGWFNDTRHMLYDITAPYVMFWLEDHISLVSPSLLDLHVADMQENSIDYMMYTFWWGGKLRARYRNIPLTNGRHTDHFMHTAENNVVIQNNAPEGVYLIAACSIFKNSLFKKIVLTDDPVQKRWPIKTPFDFEKRPSDVHWLPLRVGLPRQELFASIDDDHVHPGSCLISRGLYPNRERRTSYATIHHTL